jgi:hypothetical protein
MTMPLRISILWRSMFPRLRRDPNKPEMMGGIVVDLLRNPSVELDQHCSN